MTTTQENPKAAKDANGAPQAHATPVITVKFSELIADRKFNLRKVYPDPSELASSIKSQGQLNPLVVRATKDGKYSIVAGFCRYDAIGTFKDADFPVLVHIKEYEREDLAMLDNLAEGNRKDATNFEIAHTLKFLEDKFGTSRAHLAKSIGRTQSEVSQLITCLTDLTPAVRKAWEESIQPDATTDSVAKAAGVTPSEHERKMTAVTNRRSGEIPLSRLAKWKSLEGTDAQKKYLEAYLDKDRAVEKKESKAGAEPSGGGTSNEDDDYLPPGKKEIREAVATLKERKEKDGKLSEADEGRHKALRWVLGDIRRMG